jgi:3-methyladenine DNA glycosylase/8-oxoguanine DNA glycosylase
MPLPRPTDLRRLRAADPVLAAAMRRTERYPGFPEAGRPLGHTHYEALGRSIVYQQLAGKAAATIHGRVCALGGDGRLPRPPALLALPQQRLRDAGLSGNKLAALRDLAQRIEDGRLVLRSIGRLPDEAIIERLVSVRGIGVWTAQMFLMFHLGRLDVMPDGDLGVQEGLKRLDGLAERPRPEFVRERAQAWAPLRSIAAWTLWRLADSPG